ncbi:sensor histidine kinase [Streptomyces sp. NPDC006617]|uniref:sensor histidine kinase n=1 Tax=Streptomyces sp. NPDC006617 TaxID=3155354 RepID=UPI0033B9FEB0
MPDDGPGLRAEEIDRATTRFWRSARRAGTSGTGLGPAIAGQLLAGRGGRLGLTYAHPHGLRACAVVPGAHTEGDTR